MLQERPFGRIEDVVDAALAVRSTRSAAHHADLPVGISLDRFYHGQQVHGVRGPGQPVAAGSAGMRIDQPRPRQVAHDLRQKPRWDVHLLRDLAAAEQPIAGLGEGKHRPERVVAALG